MKGSSNLLQSADCTQRLKSTQRDKAGNPNMDDVGGEGRVRFTGSMDPLFHRKHIQIVITKHNGTSIFLILLATGEKHPSY